VRIDIAGTIESIAKITKETLYTCYETFYHPSNMLFFVVGAVDPEKTMDLIRQNQAAKHFKPQAEIIRYFEEEPDAVAKKRNEIRLSVGIPKCMFGFKEGKESVKVAGEEMFKQELATKIFFEGIIGSSTELYQSLYDDGLIDDNFGFDYALEGGFGHSMIGGDTPDPERLLERFQKEIPTLVEKGISQSDFERIRKRRIGAALRFLNSPEWIANQFTSYRFSQNDLFRMIPLLESLTLDEVNKRMREHINWDRFSVCMVKPIDEKA
jgi:predicted Zn-dependent peptidase